MEYDLINMDPPASEPILVNPHVEPIHLTLWRNPFIPLSNEKMFAPDMFANFTISLSGADTEYNFSKTVISGLSNKVCQLLISQPGQQQGIIDLNIDTELFHKGMQLIAGMPRVPFILAEIPELYCLLNYLDIFDSSFKDLIVEYLRKNCLNGYILRFIQTFAKLNEQKLLEEFLERLAKMRFDPLKENENLEQLTLETFEKILEFHQNQRMSLLFAEADAEKEDVFLSDKEMENIIESFAEKCLHHSNRVLFKNKLFERFLVKERKADVEAAIEVEEVQEVKEDINIAELKAKNEELEGRIEKLTHIVDQQQNMIQTGTQQIQKLQEQVLILMQKMNAEPEEKKAVEKIEEINPNPRKAVIQRAQELTETAEWVHEGIADAVCMQVNQTVKLSGIEVCLPGEKGITAAGEIRIYEWDYFQMGQEIAQFDVVLEYNGEKSMPLWLNSTIILRADKTYCITSKMFGGPTFASKAVKSFVNTKGLEVVFIEPDALVQQFKIGSYIFPGFYLERTN